MHTQEYDAKLTGNSHFVRLLEMPRQSVVAIVKSFALMSMNTADRSQLLVPVVFYEGLKLKKEAIYMEHHLWGVI